MLVYSFSVNTFFSSDCSRKWKRSIISEVVCFRRNILFFREINLGRILPILWEVIIKTFLKTTQFVISCANWVDLHLIALLIIRPILPTINHGSPKIRKSLIMRLTLRKKLNHQRKYWKIKTYHPEDKPLLLPYRFHNWNVGLNWLRRVYLFQFKRIGEDKFRIVF